MSGQKKEKKKIFEKNEKNYKIGNKFSKKLLKKGEKIKKWAYLWSKLVLKLQTVKFGEEMIKWSFCVLYSIVLIVLFLRPNNFLASLLVPNKR